VAAALAQTVDIGSIVNSLAVTDRLDEELKN
jgi:hypothetical protein